jgi:hypothetical protein
VTYGGDSGNRILILYWRCPLFRVSVIRGSTVLDSSCMSVRPYGAVRIPLDVFSSNLILEPFFFFRKSIEKIKYDILEYSLTQHVHEFQGNLFWPFEQTIVRLYLYKEPFRVTYLQK